VRDGRDFFCRVAGQDGVFSTTTKKEKKTEQDRHVHPITGVFRMGGKHIYVQSGVFGKHIYLCPLGQEQVELA
jgi:hypothetical protein